MNPQTAVRLLLWAWRILLLTAIVSAYRHGIDGNKYVGGAILWGGICRMLAWAYTGNYGLPPGPVGRLWLAYKASRAYRAAEEWKFRLHDRLRGTRKPPPMGAGFEERARQWSREYGSGE